MIVILVTICVPLAIGGYVKKSKMSGCGVSRELTGTPLGISWPSALFSAAGQCYRPFDGVKWLAKPIGGMRPSRIAPVMRDGKRSGA
jgi:hypothetical protein